MTDPILVLTHPELRLRWEAVVKECWTNSWDATVTSASRSYEQQKAWYALDRAGKWPTGPVANPDQFWGWSPWGMPCYGSLHMLQQDGYSHALDVSWVGPSTEVFHEICRVNGLQFPEPGEHWHAQWWGNFGIFPIDKKENDMTLDEFMKGIGREGDGQGCLKIFNGVIHQKLDDGNWYTLADVWEFIHRHSKGL